MKKIEIFLSPQIKNSSKKNVESKTHQFQLFQKHQRISKVHERVGDFLGGYLI
jgi:hypothetical protein